MQGPGQRWAASVTAGFLCPSQPPEKARSRDPEARWNIQTDIYHKEISLTFLPSIPSFGEGDPQHWVQMSLFFKYKFIYFNWRLITLQYCIGFAIHQHESATGIHVFPIPNPPPSTLPITIPLGRPSAPAPSNQYHALNLDWRFVSYMILYMFQCHSP